MTLDAGRIGIASQALGIGQAALDCAVDYAKKRIAFGQQIAKLQAIQVGFLNFSMPCHPKQLLTFLARF